MITTLEELLEYVDKTSVAFGDTLHSLLYSEEEEYTYVYEDRAAVSKSFFPKERFLFYNEEWVSLINFPEHIVSIGEGCKVTKAILIAESIKTVYLVGDFHGKSSGKDREVPPL